ncbi:MAG: phosphoribosylanthranilate isomerase, partial [Gemmatimonadales bacterium]
PASGSNPPAPSVCVKICGIREPAHAAAAAEASADYLGVVFALKLRRVTPAEASAALDAAEGRAVGVGVFVDASIDTVLAFRDAAGFGIAQLHGSETPETCAAIRDRCLPVWKALRPRRLEDLERLYSRYADVADGLLIEGFSAHAPGGTGTSFPHGWVGAVRAAAGPEIVLAGGLDPENLAAAIETARPDVVDVSSGVEAEPGVKDVALIRRFVARAKG